MHWIFLLVSCVAIIAGIKTGEVAFAVLGLGGMIIGLCIGAIRKP